MVVLVVDVVAAGGSAGTALRSNAAEKACGGGCFGRCGYGYMSDEVDDECEEW
jgi:hypothetical protein